MLTLTGKGGIWSWRAEPRYQQRVSSILNFLRIFRLLGVSSRFDILQMTGKKLSLEILSLTVALCGRAGP